MCNPFIVCRLKRFFPAKCDTMKFGTKIGEIWWLGNPQHVEVLNAHFFIIYSYLHRFREYFVVKTGGGG